jgi:hypothetical protein
MDSSAAESTTYILPSNKSTADYLRFRIDLRGDSTVAYVDDARVAVHRKRQPSPYQTLTVGPFVINTGVPSQSTTMCVDSVYVLNTNIVSVRLPGELEYVRVREAGALRVESLPYSYNVQRGQVPGAQLWQGTTRATFGVAGTYVLTEGTWVEQTSGDQRSLVSSSASDAAGGTGVRKILIRYISSVDGTEKLEVVTLNGTTRVPTVATDILHVNGWVAIDVGSAQQSVGTISMYTTAAAGTVMAQLAAGRTQTRSGAYYVPSDRKLYVSRIEMSAVGGGWAQLRYTYDWAAMGGSVSERVWQHFYTPPKYGSGAGTEYPIPLVVGPGQRLRLLVTPEINNDEWSATAFGWEEDVYEQD